jgi:pimeloyl-ACP methyl ester carboxylesterase
MTKEAVLLLHGFASSGDSTKARYFGARFKALPHVAFHAIDFNPTPKDFEYLTVTGMVNRLRQFVLDRDLGGVWMIGSSMGALVGLHYARRFGGVERMLLLAPVLSYGSFGASEQALQGWREEGTVQVPHYGFDAQLPLRYDFHADGLQYARPVPPPAPMLIIHGRKDDTVPISGSREYAASYPDRVRLIEVDADHLLHDQLALAWEQVGAFLLA